MAQIPLFIFFFGQFLLVSTESPYYDVPPNFLVAYYGDLGLSNYSAYVLKMIKAEGANLVVHAGDFDYHDNATAFDGFLTEHLGPNFPFLAAVGNHDITEWLVYKEILSRRIQSNPSLKCGGNIPDTYWCVTHGIFFAMSSIGVLRSDYLRTSWEYEQYLNASQAILATEGGKSTWKVCVWHKNQHITQTGGKADEASWNPYESCRRHGAMISTGHEHSYARSHLISKFEEPALTTSSKTSPYTMKKGETVFFVNGLGGKGVRPADPALASLPHWAKTIAIDSGVKGAVVFCRYNNGSLNSASCYLKDIDKGVLDSFQLKSSNEGTLEPYIFQYVSFFSS